jgi:UDPglucose--hexose-1-phosphate uridylyltransferase
MRSNHHRYREAVAGDDVIRDALTGTGVIIAGSRQSRPNLPAGCPFCVGGLEAPEPYHTRWFPNRWPSFPDGRAEVHLFSPDHDASLANLGPGGVRRVIDLWAERTTALGRRDDVGYVLVFENRGPQVGATIVHPHGQAFAFTDVPDAPATELAAPRCALCEDDVAPELVVIEGGGWRAWVPPAATSPFELRIAPLRHLPDLPSLDDGARRSAASVLGDAMARLDRVFDAAMPYMLWVHQRPTDGASWPHAHVHVHVQPLLRDAGTPRYIAGGELGSGVFVNPVAPVDAAAALRGV